jgi:spore coat polysaccharide biosynthesis predicted glycosyltransferase SpsG
MRVIVKADASETLGAGHVMRSLAVAEELIARGVETHFAGRIDDLTWLNKKVQNFVNLSWIDCIDCFEIDAENDILLLDSYTLPCDHPFINFNRWRNIVTLVDERTPLYKSDLQIHPGLSVSWKNSENLVYGPRYIPLRKSIIKNRKIESTRLNILVVGGGTNLHNFVSALSRELQKIESPFYAVLFSDGTDYNATFDSRFHWKSIGEELDIYAQDADLVFTTASTTCMEFIAREKAIGIVHAIDNQGEYYEALSNSGLAAPIGTFLNDSWQLNQLVIEQLVLNRNFRNNFREKTIDFIDLKGSGRIADLILQLT